MIHPSEERCRRCGQEFDLQDWEERHTDSWGNDVHAACCRGCDEEDE